MKSAIRLLSMAMFCGALLAGCAAGGDVSKPIPTTLVAAPESPKRLVIVLPGRSEDLAALERKGMAATHPGDMAECRSIADRAYLAVLPAGSRGVTPAE